MILSLLVANLKTFIRDWLNISVLIIMPLVVVTIIFLSFNPDGLREIDIGYVIQDSTISEEVFVETIAFAKLTRFEEKSTCLQKIYSYRLYTCIVISGNGPFILQVHYDNTREPVIWEIIERIKQSISLLQQEQTREITDDVFERLRMMSSEIESIEQFVQGIENDLFTQRNNLISLTQELRNFERELLQNQQTISDQFQSFFTLTRTQNIGADLDSVIFSLDVLVEQTNNLSNQYIQDSILQLRQEMQDLSRSANAHQKDLNNIESRYLQAKEQSDVYLTELSETIFLLENLDSLMREKTTELSSLKSLLRGISLQIEQIVSFDTSAIVEPISIANIPAYIPQAEDLEEEFTQEDVIRGFSFLSFQTIFPPVLIMVSLFLSILIGGYVALDEIKNPAHARIRLLKRSSLLEVGATFFSALILVMLPVMLVLLSGVLLFKFPLNIQLIIIFLVLLLFVSVSVLKGMLLAYIIKKESITLMLNTFFLILLLFLTGFLLPLERMSDFAIILSFINPATLTLEAIKKLLFYQTHSLFFLINVLLAYVVILVSSIFFLKKKR